MKGAVWRQNSCVTVVSKFMGISVKQWLKATNMNIFLYVFMYIVKIYLILLNFIQLLKILQDQAILTFAQR